MSVLAGRPFAGRAVALNHVGITVADLDRSVTFWQDLVGLELLGRGEAAHEHLAEIIGLAGVNLEWAELRIPGGGLLELFCYLAPAGTSVAPLPCDAGATHVCLEVSGIEELADRLRVAGVPMQSQNPVSVPVGDWKGWKSMYVRDPDAVIVEFVERPRNPS